MGTVRSFPVPRGHSCLGSVSGQLGSIKHKTSRASGLRHNMLVVRARSSFHLQVSLGMSRVGVAITSRT